MPKLNSGFCSVKQLGVLLLPPPQDEMLVHHRVTTLPHSLQVLLLPLDGMLVHHTVSSMKLLEVLLSPLDGMLVYDRVTPAFSLPMNTPGWKETMRSKVFSLGGNTTMSGR